jgi:hypothetical protein
MSRKVTRTIRLDDDLDKAIGERARAARVSVNSMMNRLIRKYIDWDVPASMFGLGPVAASLFNRLFDEIDEKKAEELGRKFAQEFFVPFATYLFGEFTFESSVMLFRRSSDYGGRFTFDSHSDRRNHVIVLRHNAGEKVTAFYCGMMKGLYSDALMMTAKVSCTRDLCEVRLPVAAQFATPWHCVHVEHS